MAAPKGLAFRLISIPILFLCLIFGGCRRADPRAGVQSTEFVLGTYCSITLYEGASPELFRRVFARLHEIEAVMSANRDGADLDRVNNNAGLEPTPIPQDLFEVLEQARYFAELSGGSFDPTIGPLVKLWAIGFEEREQPGVSRVPPAAEIRKALALVNWRNLELDQEAGTAFLTRPGMALDLGAIAKGYAADEAVRIIAEAGLRRAIVNLGGNIYVYGEKPQALPRFPWQPVPPVQPWRIGVQDPLEPRGAYLGVLEVGSTSIVTSGVYERAFEEGGNRYHHILSTETGYPVDNGLLSVTIVTAPSINADALSTVIFTLGYERGLDLVNSLDDVEALFVFDDRTIRGSPGALKRFTLDNPDYQIK